MDADAVGFSRLIGEDEAGTLAALKALRAMVMNPAIAKFNGRTVELMGDGALGSGAADPTQHERARGGDTSKPGNKCTAFHDHLPVTGRHNPPGRPHRQAKLS
jgi:class 3 adenylate cyclase